MKKIAILIGAGIAAIIIFMICRFAGILPFHFSVGKDIPDSSITGFYYTFYRTGENAYYLRYHFYKDEGEYCFEYETREKAGVGFLSEEDITTSGTVCLNKDQWNTFLDMVNGGTVKKRSENADAGGSGPWTYLYWRRDAGKYQQYSFSEEEKEHAFITFCEELTGNSQSTVK